MSTEKKASKNEKEVKENKVENEEVKVKEVKEEKPETSEIGELPKMDKKYQLKSNAESLLAQIKKFGVVPVIAICAVIVLVIALLGYKVTTSSPKAVFKGVINDTFKEANKVINNFDKFNKKHDLYKDPVRLNGSIKIDSDELKEIKGYEIAYDLGYQVNKEMFDAGVSVKGKGDNINARLTYQDSKAYLTSNLFDDIIELSDSNDLNIDMPSSSDMAALKEVTKRLNDFESDDYKYVLKALNQAIVKGIDPDALEKSKDTFEVDGDDVKATKLTYVLDEDSIQFLLKTLAEELRDDDKFIESLAEITDLKKSEIKDALKELKSLAKEVDTKEEVEINIYIKGMFNKIIGFDVVYENDEYISYYKKGNTWEFTVYANDDDNTKFVATATKEGKETVIDLRYAKEKVGTITVRELSEEKIDLDYNVEIDGKKYKASIYFTCKEKKDSYSGEYNISVKADDEKIDVEGTYGISFNDKVKSVNTKKAVSLEEVNYEDIKESIEKKVKNENLKDSLTDTISDIEEDSLDLNYIGMIPVDYADDAIELFDKDRATVLYVGKTYYYYDEEDQDNFLENIQDLQEELGFHSYYLSSYSVNDEFKEAVKDVKYSCSLPTETTSDETTPTETTPTEDESEVNENTETANNEIVNEKVCNEFPVLYIIKNGKVSSALRSDSSLDDIKAALNKVGIK